MKDAEDSVLGSTGILSEVVVDKTGVGDTRSDTEVVVDMDSVVNSGETSTEVVVVQSPQK